MKNFFVILTLLFWLPLFAQAGETREDSPECSRAYAERVQRQYDGVYNLQSRFTQKTESAVLRGTSMGDSSVQGHFVMAKPGKMHWRYDDGQGKVESRVISDGEKLWIYDAESKEAQRMNVGKGFLSGAAIQFLLGDGVLLDEFQITSPECDAESPLLLLRPRKEATYEKLELRIRPDTGEIVETAVYDLLGGVTRIFFQEIRVNQQLEEGLFTFIAPPEVRVIDLAPVP